MTWSVVGSGIVALAVAMGIGRFAFTPLMPLMMRDGTLSAAAGAEWAAANYGGYLVGALTASWFSSDPRRGLLLSLFGVALTTMAPHGPDNGYADPGRRRSARGRRRLQCLGAGLREQLVPGRACPATRPPAGRLDLHRGRPGHRADRRACLARRATAGRPAMAGAGAHRRRGRDVCVVEFARSKHAPSSGRRHALPDCHARHEAGASASGAVLRHLRLRLHRAGHLPAGHGPAAGPDPLVFGLTWPLFGLAAALSVAAAARWLPGWPRRRVWALAQGVMALGTALPLASHTLWALAASAVLVGGTFMVATMAGLQLAREQASCQSDAAAGPDDGRLRRRANRGTAPGSSTRPRQLGRLGCAGLGQCCVATVLLALTAAWLWHEAGDPRLPVSG